MRLPTDVKTGEPRSPLPGTIADALRARAKVRKIGSDLVFLRLMTLTDRAIFGRHGMLPGNWQDFQTLGFHDFRHTAATEMLRAGVDSRIVARCSGTAA
jgi:integrase